MVSSIRIRSYLQIKKLAFFKNISKQLFREMCSIQHENIKKLPNCYRKITKNKLTLISTRLNWSNPNPKDKRKKRYRIKKIVI